MILEHYEDDSIVEQANDFVLSIDGNEIHINGQIFDLIMWVKEQKDLESSIRILLNRLVYQRLEGERIDDTSSYDYYRYNLKSYIKYKVDLLVDEIKLKISVDVCQIEKIN